MNPGKYSKKPNSAQLKLLKKHTRLPEGSPWMAISVELIDSPAFRSLSINANRFLFRAIIEHVGHARQRNGDLIVTHADAVSYGVRREAVAAAIDELEVKGLIVKTQRGRGGGGTYHPNKFRLTFDGTIEGYPTHEWKQVTEADCKIWKDCNRKIAAEKRARKVGRKSGDKTAKENFPTSVFPNPSTPDNPNQSQVQKRA